MKNNKNKFKNLTDLKKRKNIEIQQKQKNIKNH